jgi:Spy/CpxP family protein refolding chaperone
MRGTWTKTALLLTALALPATMLPAQPTNQKAPESAVQCAPGGKGHFGKLDLSAEQRKQLRSLKMDARDQAAVIRHDQSLTREQKAARLRELRKSTREQSKAVLTPEQREQVKSRRMGRHGRMAEELGLTPDQRSKVKDAVRSGRLQRRAILQDSSLTNDRKLAELKRIRKSTRTQLASILTPEQMEQWQQMRQHRGHRGHGRHRGHRHPGLEMR